MLILGISRDDVIRIRTSDGEIRVALAHKQHSQQTKLAIDAPPAVRIWRAKPGELPDPGDKQPA